MNIPMKVGLFTESTMQETKIVDGEKEHSANLSNHQPQFLWVLCLGHYEEVPHGGWLGAFILCKRWRRYVSSFVLWKQKVACPADGACRIPSLLQSARIERALTNRWKERGVKVPPVSSGARVDRVLLFEKYRKSPLLPLLSLLSPISPSICSSGLVQYGQIEKAVQYGQIARQKFLGTKRRTDLRGSVKRGQL
jgi:hypothetical protein